MSDTLKRKTGDTSAWPPVTLYQAGQAVDLTAATAVKLRATRTHLWDPVKDTFVPLATIGTPKIDATVTKLSPATAGRVQFDNPQAADMDTSGQYRLEWEVTWAGGKQDSFPDGGYGWLQIRDQLA